MIYLTDLQLCQSVHAVNEWGNPINKQTGRLRMTKDGILEWWDSWYVSDDLRKTSNVLLNKEGNEHGGTTWIYPDSSDRSHYLCTHSVAIWNEEAREYIIRRWCNRTVMAFLELRLEGLGVFGQLSLCLFSSLARREPFLWALAGQTLPLLLRESLFNSSNAQMLHGQVGHYHNRSESAQEIRLSRDWERLFACCGAARR